MEETAEIINRIFNHRRFNLIAFFTIAILVLLTYSNTFRASFHFDDSPAIVENYAIKVVSSENIRHLLSINRPVVNMTLMLNYSLSGLNPVGWHIFNIGCHIANTFFVYLLILWTLNTPVLEKRYAGKARWMAFFGALLFGVHPVQTESVTYIITRTELLATLFYLGTFLLFIQGVRKKNFAWFVGAACSAFLSAGSKEWAVTLPAMIFLYDVLFLSEGKLKPALLRWPAYLLIALSWSFIAHTLNLLTGGGPGATVGFDIKNAAGIPLNAWTYLLTSFNVIWTYFRLLVLPIHQNLDYEYHVAQSLFDGLTFISMIGHIAVVAGAFWMYKKKGWLLLPFGLAWFYITLSPTQSFVPVMDVIFEHRIYLPSIGFIMAFLAAYAELFDWLAERRAVKAPEGGAAAQQK